MTPRTIYCVTQIALVLIGVRIDGNRELRAAEAASVRIEPRKAELVGAFARLQLQVTATSGTERRTDLTGSARYESLTPSVVSVDGRGRVTPLESGTGRIRVKDQAGEPLGEVTVVVREMNPTPTVSFREDVIPLLTKAGCNQGACHAAQHGQGGLKLSLLGYAPEQDHGPMVRDWSQRRVSLVAPEESLILYKSTAQVAHEGGKRFAVGSDAYELIKAWIAAAAPGPLEEEARVVDLTVTPKERTYRSEQRQQLRVVAGYSDGSTSDVTHRAKYDSLGDGIATVDRDGRIGAVGSGQTAVMVRYQGQANVSIVIVPYAEQVDPSGFTPANFIDELVAARWRRLGLEPVGPCSDEEFLRRAFVDCIGTLPTPKRVRRFLASSEANKRAVLVDELLGLTGDPKRDIYQEEWSAYWALKWGDLLRNNRFPLFTGIGDGGMWTFHGWIRQSLRENKPVDRFVREILTAEGSVYRNGPASYFKISTKPTDLAETTAQVFLGVRLQCARCHHHPFEVYSQADFYGLAAFFTGVKTKASPDYGALGEDTVVMIGGAGTIKHPRSGKIVPATPLLAAPVDITGIRDPREPLADWLTSPDNPMLARNIANRIWAYYMGAGLVEPIDDLRATNPPTNPELLDALAQDFITGGYDLRKLMRAIMTSRVYQLSSAPTPKNVSDKRFYSHYNAKRLPAEVLLDAIDFACGTHERFVGIGPLGARAPGVPLGTRAIELPDTNYQSVFLDTLGRPKRVAACECERTAEPNLAQILQLVNGDLIHRKLTDPKGRIAKLLERQVDADDAIATLYLVTVSRPPTPEELVDCRGIIDRATGVREGLEDILWALCNSREFLFNH